MDGAGAAERGPRGEAQVRREDRRLVVRRHTVGDLQQRLDVILLRHSPVVDVAVQSSSCDYIEKNIDTYLID